MASENAISTRNAPAGAEEWTDNREHLVPPVDIYETNDELVLVADMPGVCGDGADVRLEDGVLTLTGHGPSLEAEQAVLTEQRSCDYHRLFRLATEVDVPRIAAEMKQGVLTVRMPKLDQDKSRRITVKSVS